MESTEIDLRCPCGRTWRVDWPKRAKDVVARLTTCPGCTGGKVKFSHPATRIG